jgi:hypothetical protein
MIEPQKSQPYRLSPLSLPEIDVLQIRTLNKELRPGDLCPLCGEAQLDYDGTLNLACPRCGMALGGCFT